MRTDHGNVFVLRSTMPVPAEDLLAWYARPGALARLAPPWTSSGSASGQVRIPLVRCVHTQRVLAEKDGGSTLEDTLPSPAPSWPVLSTKLVATPPLITNVSTNGVQ